MIFLNDNGDNNNNHDIRQCNANMRQTDLFCSSVSCGCGPFLFVALELSMFIVSS